MRMLSTMWAEKNSWHLTQVLQAGKVSTLSTGLGARTSWGSEAQGPGAGSSEVITLPVMLTPLC